MKIFELPKGYHEFKTIDLQKNVKLAVLVNAIAFAIAVVVFLIGYAIYPLDISFIDLERPAMTLLKIAIVLGLIVVYLVLHELVHGIFFKKFSGKKASYGFTGLYAFAKSDAFYNKKEFFIIGLSPIVIWGAVCLILNIVLGTTFFWYIYMIQVANISGAAGDLYVSLILSKMPADILIKDDGVSMTIYRKEDDYLVQ